MGSTVEEIEVPAIEIIAGDLGDTYFIRDKAEKQQKSLRTEFFNAAKDSQTTGTPATKTWIAPEGVADPEGLAIKYNPGWLIADKQDEATNSLILVEDPDYKQVSVTAEGEDGRYVITKQIRSGSVLLDDERMLADDPDLWFQISYVPGLGILSNWIPEKDLDAVAEQLGLTRQPRNPDDLTPEEVEAIKPYLYEGPKTKALTVKLAKDDE